MRLMVRSAGGTRALHKKSRNLMIMLSSPLRIFVRAVGHTQSISISVSYYRGRNFCAACVFRRCRTEDTVAVYDVTAFP